MAKQQSKRKTNKKFEINELLVLRVLLFLLVVAIVYLFVSDVMKQRTAGDFQAPPSSDSDADPHLDMRDDATDALNEIPETNSQ